MTSTADGLATVSTSAFRRSCSVGIRIKAGPEQIWRLLTDASDFPRWNSTVRRITGTIAAGEQLKIEVPYSPRTFKVRVSGFSAPRSMVWRDGTAPIFTGVRTYTLAGRPDGSTDFTMTEELRGAMLPLIARFLPDFKPVFEQYALDLKAEAERV